MTLILKEPRYKHQKQALALKLLPEDEKESGYAKFAIGLVESWNYTGEDGGVLPIAPESFEELRIADIDELTDAINEALFPTTPKKTNGDLSPSTSTPSKAKRAGKGMSPTGSTTLS